MRSFRTDNPRSSIWTDCLLRLFFSLLSSLLLFSFSFQHLQTFKLCDLNSFLDLFFVFRFLQIYFFRFFQTLSFFFLIFEADSHRHSETLPCFPHPKSFPPSIQASLKSIQKSTELKTDENSFCSSFIIKSQRIACSCFFSFPLYSLWQVFAMS